jgi:CHASE3 domain sensor protein
LAASAAEELVARARARATAGGARQALPDSEDSRVKATWAHAEPVVRAWVKVVEETIPPAQAASVDAVIRVVRGARATSTVSAAKAQTVPRAVKGAKAVRAAKAARAAKVAKAATAVPPVKAVATAVPVPAVVTVAPAVATVVPVEVTVVPAARSRRLSR